MLRLDSSEMLPGSQKGEETAHIPSTAIVVVALATRGPRNDRVHEGQWNHRRACYCPCNLHIRFSDAHLNTKTVDGYSG